MVIDARPLAECAAQSLPGARCLPAEDFLVPQMGLARRVRAPGTAGLTGADVPSSPGTARLRRRPVARRWPAPRARACRAGRPPRRQRRARRSRMVREAVFEAPMRDDLLLCVMSCAKSRAPKRRWSTAARRKNTGAACRPRRPSARRDQPACGSCARRRPGGGEAGAAGGRGGRLRPRCLRGLRAYLPLRRLGVPAKLYAEGWAEWPTRCYDSVSYPERALPAEEKSAAAERRRAFAGAARGDARCRRPRRRWGVRRRAA